MFCSVLGPRTCLQLRGTLGSNGQRQIPFGDLGVRRTSLPIRSGRGILDSIGVVLGRRSAVPDKVVDIGQKVLVGEELAK